MRSRDPLRHFGILPKRIAVHQAGGGTNRTSHLGRGTVSILIAVQEDGTSRPPGPGWLAVGDAGRRFFRAGAARADLLASYKTDRRDVWIELGLQSIRDRTLVRVNRGHTAADVVVYLPNEGIAATGDLDGDGDMDLYVVTWNVPNRVYRNDRIGVWTDVTADFPALERHFGIRHGHIHHVDNGIAFDRRMPYRTGVDGLYAGSAGCHPAGSVIGAAGHNVVRELLADLGVA